MNTLLSLSRYMELSLILFGVSLSTEQMKRNTAGSELITQSWGLSPYCQLKMNSIIEFQSLAPESLTITQIIIPNIYWLILYLSKPFIWKWRSTISKFLGNSQALERKQEFLLVVLPFLDNFSSLPFQKMQVLCHTCHQVISPALLPIATI